MKSKALSILLPIMILFLTGCGVSSNATPTPLPTIVLGDGALPPSGEIDIENDSGSQSGDIISSIDSSSVRAEGKVVPAQKAQLASAIGGNVRSLEVSLGDEVEEGQVLVTLVDIDGIKAAVHAAELELLSAQQAYDDLFTYSDINKALARETLVEAQETLDDAQEDREKKDYDRASQETLDIARANLVIAEDAVTKKEIEYDQVDARSADDPIRAEKFAQLAAAKQNRNRMEANLNWLLGLPDELEVARADVDLELAEAQVADAERRWEDMKEDGIDDEELARVEASLNNAQANLEAAQSALDEIEIKAPFSGTISKIDINAAEWALPGQPLVVLADLSNLRVETTDLSERDAPKVEIGQPVTVFFEALGLEVKGIVAEISPLADTLGGDVVYLTRIDLDEIPEGLLAGMSADVFYNTGK